jgi:hypothetical protein
MSAANAVIPPGKVTFSLPLAPAIPRFRCLGGERGGTVADTGQENYGEPIVQSLPWWHEALNKGWTAEELVGDADPSDSLPWWQKALLAALIRGDNLNLVSDTAAL